MLCMAFIIIEQSPAEGEGERLYWRALCDASSSTRPAAATPIPVLSFGDGGRPARLPVPAVPAPAAAAPGQAGLLLSTPLNPLAPVFTPPAPAQLISPEAKPNTYTPPQEFAYDIVTRPGETITLRAAP